MTAVELIELRDARADLIRRLAPRTAEFDALLMPTVAITAPPFAAFERDEDYRRLNAMILRNCSAINFLDRCAGTVPIQKPGETPVGLMIVGEHGDDRRLLAVGAGHRDRARRPLVLGYCLDSEIRPTFRPWPSGRPCASRDPLLNHGCGGLVGPGFRRDDNSISE